MKYCLPVLAALSLTVSNSWSKDPAATSDLEALREKRVDAFEKLAASLKRKHVEALTQVRRKYQSDLESIAAIENELEIISKWSFNPKKFDYRFPAGAAIDLTVFIKPEIDNEEDLEDFLVGSTWSYWENEEWAGSAFEELEFISNEECKLDGQTIDWKIINKNEIWIETDLRWGGVALKFRGSDFDKMAGKASSDGNRRRSIKWKSSKQ